MVILDNDTRWNSQYYSIERALKLRERITIFCSRHKDTLSDDNLSDDDWTYLATVKDYLEPFIEATNSLEGAATNGQYGAIWEWLIIIEGLISEMERVIEAYKSSGKPLDPLALAHDRAWSKLQKYYQLSDDDYNLYAAATLFAPESRMAYFDRNWTGELAKYKQIMLERVRREWVNNYKPAQDKINMPPPAKPSMRDRQLGRVPVPDKGDQFNTYVLSSPSELAYSDEEHVLSFWDNDKCQFPQLRQMAFDLLSIPATSCSCERIFSSTKKMISPAMGSLKDDTIELRECLRQWLKAGLIELQLL
jgi:hypothetical protein